MLLRATAAASAAAPLLQRRWEREALELEELTSGRLSLSNSCEPLQSLVRFTNSHAAERQVLSRVTVGLVAVARLTGVSVSVRVRVRAGRLASDDDQPDGGGCGESCSFFFLTRSSRTSGSRAARSGCDSNCRNISPAAVDGKNKEDEDLYNDNRA